MKICMVNGSPKRGGGASAELLKALEIHLGAVHEYARCTSADIEPQELAGCMRGSDAAVVAFPLYADGIPSHLLRLLLSIETSIKECGKLYVIVNNGFYEARQNQLAIDMMRIFCCKAGLEWGQGVGIGGGAMISDMTNGAGLMKKAFRALGVLAENISSGRTQEDIFINPVIPRFLYIFGGNSGWKKLARKNGISIKKMKEKI